jgi:hypothetical protein
MSPYPFMCGPYDGELEARRAAMLFWGRSYYYRLKLDMWEVRDF